MRYNVADAQEKLQSSADSTPALPFPNEDRDKHPQDRDRTRRISHSHHVRHQGRHGTKVRLSLPRRPQLALPMALPPNPESASLCSRMGKIARWFGLEERTRKYRTGQTRLYQAGCVAGRLPFCQRAARYPARGPPSALAAIASSRYRKSEASDARLVPADGIGSGQSKRRQTRPLCRGPHQYAANDMGPEQWRSRQTCK